LNIRKKPATTWTQDVNVDAILFKSFWEITLEATVFSAAMADRDAELTK
jgi:hypothetical protein